MLKYADVSAAIKEPKSVRMEQRVKPHMKSTIQNAAALLGIDESTFVANAAYTEARQVIGNYEAMTLSAEDRDVFFAAMESPPEPSEAMMRSIANHRRLIARDAG